MFKYLYATRELGLALKVNDNISVLRHIDASYGVHLNGNSHTGFAITLGSDLCQISSADCRD